MSDTTERVKLTPEQLASILPDKEQIHTFMQGGPVLIGADWSKEDILEEASKFTAELSGEQATRMEHGAAITGRPTGPLFVETDAEKLSSFTA